MPSSTRPCGVRGTYRGDCSCRPPVTLAEGDPFPMCPNCRRAITWTMLREVNVRRHRRAPRASTLLAPWTYFALLARALRLSPRPARLGQPAR